MSQKLPKLNSMVTTKKYFDPCNHSFSEVISHKWYCAIETPTLITTGVLFTVVTVQWAVHLQKTVQHGLVVPGSFDKSLNKQIHNLVGTGMSRTVFPQ